MREGEVVPVRIIRIDAARHRLGLSLRQASGDLDLDEPAVAPVSVATSVAAVELAEDAGIEGVAESGAEAQAAATESSEEAGVEAVAESGDEAQTAAESSEEARVDDAAKSGTETQAAAGVADA